MKRRGFIKLLAALPVALGFGGLVGSAKETATFSGRVTGDFGYRSKGAHVGVQSIIDPSKRYTVKVDESGDWSCEVELDHPEEVFMVCPLNDEGFVLSQPHLVKSPEAYTKANRYDTQIKWPGDLS